MFSPSVCFNRDFPYVFVYCFSCGYLAQLGLLQHWVCQFSIFTCCKDGEHATFTELHTIAAKMITKNTFQKQVFLARLILYKLQDNLFTKQITSHLLLQTWTNQWQHYYKENGLVEFFVIITKNMTNIFVPRNYFVILSARMVLSHCTFKVCQHSAPGDDSRHVLRDL